MVKHCETGRGPSRAVMPRSPGLISSLRIFPCPLFWTRVPISRVTPRLPLKGVCTNLGRELFSLDPQHLWSPWVKYLVTKRSGERNIPRIFPFTDHVWMKVSGYQLELWDFLALSGGDAEFGERDVAITSPTPGLATWAKLSSDDAMSSAEPCPVSAGPPTQRLPQRHKIFLLQRQVSKVK